MYNYEVNNPLRNKCHKAPPHPVFLFVGEIFLRNQKMIRLFFFLNFSLRSPRSTSPQRTTQLIAGHSRNVSPSFADSTFSAVHAALNKRQVQVFYLIFNVF